MFSAQPSLAFSQDPTVPPSEDAELDALVGHPQLDGYDGSPAALAPLAEPLAERTISKTAPLYSNAVTAAYTDPDTDQVYAATRSASPAQLYVHDRETGETTEHRLHRSQGAWSISKSGKWLAIGTTAAWNANSTEVQFFDTSRNKFLDPVVLPGANIVMEVAADTFESDADDGVFWAGTYHRAGAKLFKIDLRAGTVQQRGAWSGSHRSYVRSLSVTEHGVTVGLGTEAQVFEITEPCTNASACPAPQRLRALDDVLAQASFAYSMASADIDMNDASESGESPDWRPLSVIGTEQPARIAVLDHKAATVLASHADFPQSTTVDRVTIDADSGTAWFTVRPFGELYSWDLHNPEQEPVLHGTPVFGSETRELRVHEGLVTGISGTSELWSYDSRTQTLLGPDAIVPEHLERPDSIPQGLIRHAGKTLVSGHWRYQVHSGANVSTLPLPGEPKAHTRVGDHLYAALYPSASVYRIDADMRTDRVAILGNGQVRPAAIEYHDGSEQLLVATGPAYGEYGGGLSTVAPEPDATPKVFTRPVGNQQVSAIEAGGDGYYVGTWIRGEAMPNLNENAQIRRWRPIGNANTGTSDWVTRVNQLAKVTGITTVSDAAGSFLLATGVTKSDTGWIAALNPSNGAILWQESTSGAVTSLDQENGYITALVNGTIRQLGASRTALTISAVRQSPSGAVAFSSLDPAPASQQQIAYVGSGMNAQFGIAKQGIPRIPHRTAGLNRYATAVAVSQETYTSASTVLLARGDDYADALAAGPLAAQLGAPVLLTRNGTITPETQAEIRRLGAKTAIPIGGTGAIPNSVRNYLPSGTRLDTAGRLAGPDRYTTSLAVAKRLERISSAGELEVMVATGRTFADAISAGAAAIHTGKAIVLYDHTAAAAPVGRFIASRTVHALGGPAVSALRKANIPVRQRIIGSDRFDTARLIADRYFSRTSHAYVANGLDFPDGLAASVLAGRQGAPLLLARPTVLTPPTERALSAHRGAQYVMLVGGTGVLKPALQDQIRLTPHA